MNIHIHLEDRNVFDEPLVISGVVGISEKVGLVMIGVNNSLAAKSSGPCMMYRGMGLAYQGHV